jgi:hypothetical protein
MHAEPPPGRTIPAQKQDLHPGDKAVDEIVSQVEAARVDKEAGADVGAPSRDKAGAMKEAARVKKAEKDGAMKDAMFLAETEAARAENVAASIAAAHRLSKAAADQQDAARVAKAGAEVDAAGDVTISDDDFEDDNDPLNLQKQYLQACPRPELKKLATEAGLNLKGNTKKPTLVKSLLAHYAKRVAQVGYTHLTTLFKMYPQMHI